MDACPNKTKTLIICLILAAVTFAVYYQVHSFSFVNLDDSVYAEKNPVVQSGITLKSVKWAFLSTKTGSIWHPLTWISLMLDCQLFGKDAGGHYLVNLFLHIANTLLLFIVLRQMTKTLWQSAFVAALFALHPLHVESVAWVTERKDVLSIFFWMLTMWAYARYVEKPKIINYLLIVVFFAFGLMSKAMVVTLPFVLLLLDYWPLDRLYAGRPARGRRKALFDLCIEKIPLFAMSLADCVVTYIAQEKQIQATSKFSLLIRLANASVSYLQYIIKMIWPARLAVFYPHAEENVPVLYAIISVVLLLIITILVLRSSMNRRYLITGWFWYLGTLIPVIGLVQVGNQAMADRYTYIPLTGLFIIIAWGVPDVMNKLQYKKAVLASAAILIISAASICSYFQVQYWKDSITLFQHAIEVTKDNYISHYGMAEPLRQQGRFDEAMRHHLEALRIKPRYPIALYSLGTVFQKEGKIDDAIYYYRKAIELRPGLADAHFDLSNALIAKGLNAEAIKHLEEVLRLEPDRIPAMNNLAWFLAADGSSTTRNPDRAASLAGRACELTNYQEPTTLDTLAMAYAAKGEFDKAVQTAQKALPLCKSDELRNEIEARLALYKAGKPYIE